MPFRPLISALCLLLAPALSAADLSIVRVFTGWRAAASFKRISEYFDGKENTGREVILRSHPEQRTGYYFLVRLKNPGATLKASAHLELIGEGWQKSRTTVFPLEIPANSTVFQLGLTGPEWQNPEVQPIAWRLRILNDSGDVLAAEKSYLWETPPAK